MGLGVEVTEADEYEWFRVEDVPSVRRAPFAGILGDWLREHPLWRPDGGTKVLLVDLDNLRAEPARLAGRITAIVGLARAADYAAFAGQAGAVERARPNLAEFADGALVVDNAGDAADWALLDAAAAAEGEPMQIVLVSNDGIFADLAERGMLTVLSPGVAALSDRLRDAATEVVDMKVVEQGGRRRGVRSTT